MDAKRWNDFLVADHRAPGTFSSYHFERWLVEVEEWPPMTADRLVRDREKALQLLEHNDHAT